jgi:protein-S-isoprenylcysteine O-methyltransferase Ste14
MTETNEAARADHAGVIVLPPLLYVAGLAVAFAINFLVPLPMRFGPVGRVVGIALVLAAFMFAASARDTMTGAGTNVNPREPTLALVTGGPFRFSRNPMYVAITAGFIGMGLAMSTWWVFILLFPIAATMHWGVVRREERYLEAKFGEPYREFRRRVRRYL